MANTQHRIAGEHVYEGDVYPGMFPSKNLDQIKQTIFDDSDVMVIAYPKAGTTVLSELVYLVHSGGDFATSDKLSLSDRCQFIDAAIPPTSRLETALKMPPPRLMKSHLSTKFFQETLKTSKTKFVVGMRNPKDTLVSFYHFYRMCEVYNNFPGTWDEYFTIFKENRLAYGNYFENVGSWWDIRDQPNVLVVKYEDIVQKPQDVIRQVAEHLEKNIPDDVVQKIADRIAFKNMKETPTLNFRDVDIFRNDISPFMRKGEIGDWRNYFNKEQNQIIEDLYQKHCVQKGLLFQF